MRPQLLVATIACAHSALAVFADEAWSVDYHYALLGEPKEPTTFFHQPNPSSKASLLYTLSEEGVLGAVNPRDGSIVWRQLPQDAATASNATFLRPAQGDDIVVSGVGREVAAWSAADGRQVWSYNAPGQLADVEILELGDGRKTPGAKDAIVLSGGDNPEILRLDGASGAIKWQHKLDGGDVAYQVSASNTEVFAILLHKTMLGYQKIKVITLSPVDGRKTDDHELSSDSDSSAHTIVAVGANSASPIIAFTDVARSVLKVNIIGTKNVASFNIERVDPDAVEEVHLHAPYHTNSLAHFLVHYQTANAHWADVFHIDLTKNSVRKAYSLPKAPGRGAFSTSTSNANVYFSRITSKDISTFSSLSNKVLGSWAISSFGTADQQSQPVHAVSETSIKGDTVSAIRTAVLLESGDWVLLRDGKALWQRPEVLASTITATFALPANVEHLTEALELESHSNPVRSYLHRIKRHIEAWQHFPAFLSRLPERITRNMFGTSADKKGANIFGFHKIIVCGTKHGRLVAIDAGAPDKILWNKKSDVLNSGMLPQTRLDTTTGGVVTLETEAENAVLTFNASTGEVVPSTSEPDVVSSSAKLVKYTLRDGELKATSDSHTMWHFMPASGDRIVSLVPRPVNDPVASIGKVMGDRKVLYKYLNPNLALLSTANDAKRSASFYVLDTVSGAVLHSSTHKGVDLQAPVSAILSENWFAYSYTSEPSEDSPKGYQLVSGEIFESLAPNDRGPLTGLQNFSSVQANSEPFTLTQSYQISEAITKLSVTQTRQSITSRQLLAVLADSNSIVGIPQGIIDPRRPVGRDPTKKEQMEGLARYDPVLEFNPKWYLNHQREVMGVKDVITSPALLESTSLVFAYGLDVFGTRLSPSFNFDMLGKDFNKFQMLATVAALAVATVLVAPLVQRKQVNARWQFA